MFNVENFENRFIEGFNDVQVYEKQLETGVVLVIMRGGLNQPNPKNYMDAAVSEYVQHDPYNEFIEIFLDNPWIRVLIFGINELHNGKDIAWRTLSKIKKP